MKIIQLIGSLLDRLLVVLGAFAGSQIPEFMQQYTQRLGGHVHELNRLINQLHGLALQSHKTLEQYIHKFLYNSDMDFIQQGEFMNQMLIRWENLDQILYRLNHSSIWERPYVFLTTLQSDIAESTLASFQPGLNLNLEGLSYAIIGMLGGWIFYQILSKCLISGWSRGKSLFKQSL